MKIISNKEAEELESYRKAIISMDECLGIQKTEGNWDYSEYMHGMTNGMILFRSFFAENTGSPGFLNAPSKWVYKKSLIRQIKNFVKKHFGFTNFQKDECPICGLAMIIVGLLLGVLFTYLLGDIG